MKRIPRKPVLTPAEQAAYDAEGRAYIALLKKSAAAWLAKQKREAA